MSIVLRSEVLEVTKIVKKTKAVMLKDLKVGSRIQLSIQAKEAGMNRGTYASYITIRNLETGECTFKSFNEISILNNFELKSLPSEVERLKKGVDKAIFDLANENVEDTYVVDQIKMGLVELIKGDI